VGTIAGVFVENMSDVGNQGNMPDDMFGKDFLAPKNICVNETFSGRSAFVVVLPEEHPWHPSPVRHFPER